jgi:tRNA(His) 5'-end guanylyltransferase
MYTEFDKRIKDYYEKRAQTTLYRRIPVIIRLDGKCFHSFCKRFDKPYDEFLNFTLNNVMKFLCENIQGTKLAARHSDEISLLLTDFDTLQTDAFFDYEVQKICSIVASMTTSEFCRKLIYEKYPGEVVTEKKMYLRYDEKWPTFDCRCFNIPTNEVANYFYWRLLDCVRGSINSVAQYYFSSKELYKKSCNEMQEMLFQKHNINWSKYPNGQKNGFMCIRKKVFKAIEKGPDIGKMTERNIWSIEESDGTKASLDEIINNIEFVKNE